GAARRRLPHIKSCGIEGLSEGGPGVLTPERGRYNESIAGDRLWRRSTAVRLPAPCMKRCRTCIGQGCWAAKLCGNLTSHAWRRKGGIASECHAAAGTVTVWTGLIS